MSDLKFSSGDTAWLLICTALVLLMTPGLALYYGGMVRRKNVLGTLIQSWIVMGVVAIEWAIVGYSLSFDRGSPVIGGCSYAFLSWKNLAGLSPSGYADTAPHIAFACFQMMAATFGVALIFGAVADRMKFKALIVFTSLWTLLIYAPIAHTVWGNGGLLRGVFENGQPFAASGKYPMLDFAGGAVLQAAAGVAALVCCVVLGNRVNYEREPMPPHNMVLTTTGAGLLWFGWMGLIGGSAMRASEVAAVAFAATHLAAAAAMLTWVVIEWKHRGHPSLLGAVSGAITGLAAISPAAGFIEPINGIWIGIIGSAAAYLAIGVLKARLNYDDSLDTFGVHGVGGIVGVLLTGVFASAAVNPAGTDGLFRNHPLQMVNQIIGVLAVVSFSSIGTFVLLKITGALVGLRVSKDEELEGLDLTQHREVGYNL